MMSSPEPRARPSRIKEGPIDCLRVMGSGSSVENLGIFIEYHMRHGQNTTSVQTGRDHKF